MEDTLMTKYRSVYRTILLLGLMACAASANAAVPIPSRYRVTDLGILESPNPEVLGINASGHVTGTFRPAGSITLHAFIFDGAMHDLGTLPGASTSYGFGINDTGQVTGESFPHAFLYDGTMHDLGTLGGHHSYGQGINASGQVTGVSHTTVSFEQRAFLWTPTTPNGTIGTMLDLGTFPGGSQSDGRAINDHGHVTGWAMTDYVAPDFVRQQHAFLYDGAMHDLGTLGGTESYGHDINNSGQVAGVSHHTPGSFESHAFLWTPTTPNAASGAMHDLGTLGGESSIAYGINDNGQVTGRSDTANAAQHAFLYTGGIGMVDLNSLINPQSGWDLVQGLAINDAAQIAGWGLLNGEGHSFLLTPVPEPTSLALLALGLPIIVWHISRRTLNS
jgi:probable HAF family extracellular repeat protein